jgi:hypothetical protein
MTQDGRALVLENTIVVRRSEVKAGPSNTTTVKVVGLPLPETDSNVEAYWMADEGDALQTVSVNLLRDSLVLALRDMEVSAASGAADFRTVRYREGGAEKMERARIINESESRLVLRNLRGWILSVPIATPARTPTPARPPTARAATESATAIAPSQDTP